jgi:hypothetical protein
MKQHNIEVDYCGISNQDDFHNYETIISFKYKIINMKYQFSKICDFITDYTTELNYDWYMKIRPDIKLLENIHFDVLSENAIHARARVYHGPLHIKYGMSINGEGIWRNIGDCSYTDKEKEVILDDMLFIFHKNIISLCAFDKLNPENTESQNEWLQTSIWNNRNIPLSVIGIYLENTKYNTISGNVN